MSQGYRRSAFGSASSHGFSKELISDVVARCHKLFSVEDIIVNVPVFSRRHAVAILGILNEIFDDISKIMLKRHIYLSWISDIVIYM